MARVLIIDDDRRMLLTLAEVVTGIGHTVTTANDGAEGLRAFFGADFDLVLTDLAMPGIDGLEVLRRIKTSRPETPVVVVTGNSTMDLLATAINQGVDAYITKPFEIAEIDRQLSAMLPRSAVCEVTEPVVLDRARERRSGLGPSTLWVLAIAATGLVLYLTVL